MKIIYSYIQKNLLKDPEKYQMTPYLGLPFLSSFIESRKIFLNSEITEFDSSELIKLLSEKSLLLNNLEKVFFTFDLFSEILKNFLKHNFDSKIINLVNIFIKKFEIGKKIFRKYNSNIKEIDSNFFELKNYILFSIVCEILFLQTNNLKYLNVSLKLNDLVCSQNNLLDKIDRKLMNFSIIKEFESLKFISKKTGVNFL
jgi:hypothetical protein